MLNSLNNERSITNEDKDEDEDDIKSKFNCFLNCYNEENEYFKKIFFIIIIQHLLIILFLFLDFLNLDLNKPFIKNKVSIIFASIIPGIYCGVVRVFTLVFCVKEQDEFEGLKSPFINILSCLYVPLIIIYCFLLSNFIDKKYILIIVCQILLYYISLEIYLLFMNSFKVIKFVIPLFFDNVLSFLVLFFFIIKRD